MPAAGRMDRRVAIWRNMGTTAGPTGQPTEDWQVWKTVWMGTRDVRSDERFRADQELATRSTVFVSHYIDGVLSTDRLVCEGITYDVIGIAEMGRHAGLEITAQAVGV